MSVIDKLFGSFEENILYSVEVDALTLIIEHSTALVMYRVGRKSWTLGCVNTASCLPLAVGASSNAGPALSPNPIQWSLLVRATD